MATRRRCASIHPYARPGPSGAKRGQAGPSGAKRGQPANVVISGRNARRVIHGALNAATGELVQVVRERSRQDDCLAFVERLTQVRPDVPKLLIWDNAPPHHPRRVREAAERTHITIAWLPFRAPELNPCEDLWRLMKADIAANRPPSSIDDLAQHAVTWLDALAPDERLRRCGLFSAKFQWLST